MRAIDNANYEIVTTRSDIKIQNIGNNAVVVTNGRLYRDDQASVLYAENGDKPISMDSGALTTNVQPMVESALNANAKISSINNNTKIIPALL
jgi:5-keto 4-deoxyuronate isomerase